MFDIRSKITQKLLGYYIVNPKSEHHLNELARILGVDAGNLDKKIKELEKDGIFVSERKGNLRLYRLNGKYPLLSQLKKFFLLKYGLEKELVATLKKIKGLEKAFIFGSYAKGGFEAQSDIDLLLIGSHSSLDASRSLVGLENKFKREFNAINITDDDFEKRRRKKDELLADIFTDKTIKLI